jgi:cbb3-type cytochrome oxidase cytochrome c subunit
MIIGQGGYWYEDIKSKFDKVVVIYRENIKEQAESYVHAYNSIDWHTPYIYDPSKVPEDEYLKAYTKFKDRIDELKSINDFTVKYEDLYISGIGKDELDKHLGITNKAYRFMLDGKNKYRREPAKEIKTLI